MDVDFYTFLGAFPILRKATTIFVTSVPMEQLCSHWTDFHDTSYLSIFRKSKYVYVHWLVVFLIMHLKSESIIKVL